MRISICTSLVLFFASSAFIRPMQAGQAGPCYLVKKINTDQTQSSSIGSLNSKQFASIGSIGYFPADDGVHGTELWRTDGTPNGTYMLRDIVTTAGGYGNGSSFPDNLTVVGSTLYFTAIDPGYGSGQPAPDTSVNLWKTDGTEAGTVPVTTFNTGNYNSGPPKALCACGSKILFFSFIRGGYYGLYVSDGTQAGTKSLLSNAGNSVLFPNTSIQPNIVNVGGICYFAANDATSFSNVNGVELWRSDGTRAGTYMVKDIAPGTADSNIDLLTGSGSNVFFTASDTGGNTGSQLWRSDGTTAGTIKLGTYPAPQPGNYSLENLIDVAGTLVFDAFDGTNKNIYKTDGVTVSTLLNRSNGRGSSRFSNSVGNGKLYYNSGGALYEMNVTTGVESQLIPTGISTALAIGTKIFYPTGGSANGNELHVYDRSNNNNYLVADINPGVGDSGPSNFFPFGGYLFFTANNGTLGVQPYQSDGITATLIKDINTSTNLGTQYPMIAANNRVFYTANQAVSPSIYSQLYSSDGTAAGTGYTDFSIIASTFLGDKAAFGNSLYFGGKYYDTNSVQYYGSAIYSTNGALATSDNLTAGVDVLGDAYHGFAGDLVAIDATHLVFTAPLRLTGYKALYVSNGTNGNFTQLKQNFDRGGSPSLAFNPRGQAFNGKAYYVADDSTGRKIWSTDGVNAPVAFANFVPQSFDPGNGIADQGFFVAGNHMFFVAGGILYSTDGTPPVAIKDFKNNISSMTVSGGKLCMIVYVNGNGGDLWTSDGVTATQVTAYATSNANFQRTMADVNGTLYLAAQVNFSSTFALYKSNLTTAGTVQVHSWTTGAPTNLFNAGGTLVFIQDGYFTPQQGYGSLNPFGTELWRSDGTDAGTVMVQDIYPGPSSSLDGRTPYFCVAGTNLYFLPNNFPGGKNELWAMPLSALSVPAPSITNQSVTVNGTVTVPITPYQITATNGANYFTAYNLPLGISINSSTGLISGTPAYYGSYYVATISAVNGGATAAIQVTFNIARAEPVFTSSPNFGTSTTNTPITPYTPTVTGAPTITYSLTGTVPAWVKLNTATGTISGTPGTSDTGSSNFQLVATNGSGTASQTIYFTVNPPPPHIDSSLTAAVQVGNAFSYTMHATGTGTLTYSAFLPYALSNQGFTFDSVNKISGTPTTAGTYNITLQVTDPSYQQDIKTLVLTVTTGPVPVAPTITSAGSLTVGVGAPFTYTITATGTAPITYSATPLPTGVTFDNVDTLTGTLQTAGNYQIPIAAQNAAGMDSKVLNITVSASLGIPPVITSSKFAAGNVGSNFTYTITATGTDPLSYSTGPLPANLVLTGNVISGIPQTAAGYTLALTVMNIAGTATQNVSLTVGPALPPPPVITSAAAAIATAGQSFSFTVTATNNPQFTQTGKLPAGITFTDKGNGKGILAGTPDIGAAGTYPLTFTADNGSTPVATQNFKLTVAPPQPPVITSALSPLPTVAGVGQNINFLVAATSTTLSYKWDFGDGTSVMTTTPTVTYFYSAAGTYTAVVTVTDTVTNLAAASAAVVTIVSPIVGTGKDSDGDGFSDDFESVVGSDPFNAGSTPTGQPINPVIQPLTLSNPVISTKIVTPVKASISVSGTFAVPADPQTTKTFMAVEGVTIVPTAKSLKITLKKTKGSIPAQTAKFTLKTTGGAEFTVPLGVAGLGVNGGPVTLKFSLIFNNTIYQKVQSMTYKAVKDRHGVPQGGTAK